MADEAKMTADESVDDFTRRILGTVTLDDMIEELGRRYYCGVVMLAKIDPANPSGMWHNSWRTFGPEVANRGLLAFGVAQVDANHLGSRQSCDPEGRICGD